MNAMRKLSSIGLVLVLLLVIGADTRAGSQPRAGLPYKIYVALLTQLGTADPTTVVLQNTLGVDLVFGRIAAGLYQIGVATELEEFPVNKTLVTFGPPFLEINRRGTITITDLTGTRIKFNTRGDGDVASDGVLSSTALEIRVYP